MASVHVIKQTLRSGATRYRVRFRLGGAESQHRYGGSFRTRREAEARARWISGELAAMRVPDLRQLADESPATLADAVARWTASRIDVDAATRNVDRKSIAHALTRFGRRDPTSITPAEVAAWVGELAAENPPVPDGARKRTAPYSHGSIRKYRTALALVLDHEAVTPNPARDLRVKLPRRRRAEVIAPEVTAVEAVLGTMAPRYRLPVVVLDTTSMRVGELESLRWGDLDAQGVIVPPLPLPEWLGEGEDTASRWRVAIEREKTERGRWVPVPRDVFAAVEALVPREDRDLEAEVFPWLNQAALRREIARAAKATGTPLWSPHGLRRRRISLWHRAGVSWAQVGEWAGQRDLAVTSNTYTRVIVGREVNRAACLPSSAAGVGTPVGTP